MPFRDAIIKFSVRYEYRPEQQQPTTVYDKENDCVYYSDYTSTPPWYINLRYIHGFLLRNKCHDDKIHELRNCQDRDEEVEHLVHCFAGDHRDEYIERLAEDLGK